MKSVVNWSLFLLAVFVFLGQKSHTRASVTLKHDCVNLDASSPNQLFNQNTSSDLLQCCIRNRNEEGAILLRHDKNGYYIPEGNTERSTWLTFKMTDKIHNDWLPYLAAAKPMLSFVNVDIPGVFLFSGKFGPKEDQNYALWAWKFDPANPERKPVELKVADLLSGDEADRALVRYLKKDSNLKQSGIYAMLNEWRDDPQKGFTVVEILGGECVYDNPDIGAYNCEDRIEQGQSIFTSADSNRTKLPDCTESSLNHDKPLNLLLRNKSGTYKVYESNTGGQYTADIAEDFIGNVESISKGERLKERFMAWMVILCFSDCKEILERNGEFIIVGCDKKIVAYDTISKKQYNLIDLVDQERVQESFVSNFNTPTAYTGSIIQKLFNHWKNTGEQLVIRAFAENDIGYDGGFDLLRDALENSYNNNRPLSSSGAINYLLEKETSSGRHKYYWVSGNSLSAKEQSWYDQDSIINHQLAILAAWRHDIVKLTSLPSTADSPFYFSFTTPDRGEEQLWTWKITDEKTVEEDYACLETLWGDGLTLSHEITKNLDEYDPRFQGNFKNIAESMGQIKLRQVFPVNTTSNWSNYSPLASLGYGSGISSTSGETMPPHLRNALSNQRKQLQFLVEESFDLQLMKPSGADLLVNGTWGDLLKDYENPWSAWLYMVNPDNHVVAYDESNISRIKFCSIHPNDINNNLWAWVENVTDGVEEYKLVDGEETFLWNKKLLQQDFTKLLISSVTQEEKAFFLEYADRPDDFELVDFFDDGTDRLLTWRDPRNPDAHRLYRIGKGIALTDGGVALNLVDGKWDGDWSIAKERYIRKWYRTHFYEEIATSTDYPLHTWLGENKLGLSKGAAHRLAVFLNNSEGKRNFGYMPLGDILEQVDGYDFIPRSPRAKPRAGRKPQIDELFNAFVANQGEWNKVDSLWRTNPLGYFD